MVEMSLKLGRLSAMGANLQQVAGRDKTRPAILATTGKQP